MTPEKEWRKSSYSGTNGECVELHRTSTMIRDSKNHNVLPLNRGAVAGLLRAVRSEQN